MIQRLALLFVLLVAADVARAQATQPATRPVEEIRRVLIVSIDGLRPDLALRADMPHLRQMLKDGTYSFWARTVPAAVTMPSHASMLTGVPVEQHGINFNTDIPADKPMIYSRVPTLFELAKSAGYSTAMVTGKSKFEPLAKPGSVDFLDLPKKNRFDDVLVANLAAGVIKHHKPEVMFVHLGTVDSVGHAIGWGTDQQLEAIEKADAALGVLLAALRDAGVIDQTLVIVSADHGGSGKTHGKDDARSRHIPWIATGPGVRPNYDLTRLRELEINTEDTFATACHVLGIKPGDVQGKPITAIFPPPPQLLQDLPTTAPTTQPVSN